MATTITKNSTKRTAYPRPRVVGAENRGAVVRRAKYALR